MKFVEAQLLQMLGWVLRDHAMIVSGAYRFKKSEVGCGYNDNGTIRFRPQTDEEKFKSAMDAMEAHMKLVGDCVNCIGEHQDGPKNPPSDIFDNVWEKTEEPPR